MLEDYCEDLEIAVKYYEGEKDIDDFIDWYTETYIHSAEVIYYHNAIKFLAEHDPSLTESMEKAEEYGYTPKQLNSELLASLLLQDVLINDLNGEREKIGGLLGIGEEEEEKAE